MSGFQFNFQEQPTGCLSLIFSRTFRKLAVIAAQEPQQMLIADSLVCLTYQYNCRNAELCRVVAQSYTARMFLGIGQPQAQIQGAIFSAVPFDLLASAFNDHCKYIYVEVFGLYIFNVQKTTKQTYKFFFFFFFFFGLLGTTGVALGQ